MKKTRLLLMAFAVFLVLTMAAFFPVSALENDTLNHAIITADVMADQDYPLVTQVAYVEPDAGDIIFISATDAVFIELDYENSSIITLVDESNLSMYKWSYMFNLPDQNFVLHAAITSANMRIVNGRHVIINNKYFVSFDDILEHGFNYTVTQTDANTVVYEITKDWLSYGIEVGDEVFIDPTLTAYAANDGYISWQRTDSYSVDVSSTTMLAGNDVGTGDSDYFYRTFLRFNTSAVDLWDTIINATVSVRVSAKSCSSGSSRFWLQNISDYGILGLEDWNSTYQNITIYFYANENATGWRTVDTSSFVTKSGFTAYRIAGTYENYDGVDCFITMNSLESAYVPYLEVWWSDGSPDPPNITIISPRNETYDYRILNLSVVPSGGAGGISSWWYSLNGGANVTFAPNTTIVSNLGSNCIDVYLNNTYGRVSKNSTCYTVTKYSASLDCWPSPAVVQAGSIFTSLCNYTYQLNGSSISGASCYTKLNDTVTVKRFYSIDDEEALYGDTLGGFGILLPSSVSSIGGGAYLKCTNSTSGNFDIYIFISTELPFTSLNGTKNITQVNYTMLYGSYSCAFLDAVYHIKNNMTAIALPANMTWAAEKLALLGNPPVAYYGFFGGCPTCTGGDDAFFIGVNTHNRGYTYHGNTSQTSDWLAEGVEHGHWLYMEVPPIPMDYNSSTGLYNVSYPISQWSDERLFHAYGNCSGVVTQGRVDAFTFNVSAADLPSCSFTSYSSVVTDTFNQTFTWNATSTTPFTNLSARIICDDVVKLFVDEIGTFSIQMNGTGSCTLTCRADNLAGYDESVVPFIVAETEYYISAHYSMFASVGDSVTIQGFVINEGITVHPTANLTIDIDGESGNMTYNASSGAYEIVWIPSFNGNYNFTITGDIPPLIYGYGNITILPMSCINMSIWTNVTMPADSLYKNEWAWIYAVRQLDPSLEVLFGKEKFTCPPMGADECYWHGKYIDGIANICLPAGYNYTFYIAGNNIEFSHLHGDIETDCPNCPPTIVSQKLLYPLGSYFISSPEHIHLYVNPTDLGLGGGLFGGFTGNFAIVVLGIIAFVFFLLVLALTGSLTAAIAAMVLAPFILYLITHAFLFG